MKILDKSLLKQFLQTFVLASLSLVILFLLNLFLEIASAASEVSEEQNRDLYLIGYLLFSVPKYWTLTLPFALLFATVFTLAKRKETNALLVMEASGIRFSRIILPIFIVSFFLHLFKPHSMS